MCSPTLALTVGAALFQAKAAIDQGKFEEGKAKYNARVTENAAQDTVNAGVEEENAHRLKVARLQSQQRTQLGALNVDVNSGSAFQLQEDTETLGEADAFRIRTNTNNQADALIEKSKLTLAEGKYAAAAGKNKAFGSLLSAGAKVAGSGVADKWFTPGSAAKVGSISSNGAQYAYTPTRF